MSLENNRRQNRSFAQLCQPSSSVGLYRSTSHPNVNSARHVISLALDPFPLLYLFTPPSPLARLPGSVGAGYRCAQLRNRILPYGAFRGQV